MYGDTDFVKALQMTQSGASERDLTKMAEYFDTKLDPGSFNAKMTGFVKDAAPFLGPLMDFAVLGPLVGTPEAPAGIGAILTGGVARAAEATANTTTRFLLNVGKTGNHLGGDGYDWGGAGECPRGSQQG